MSLNSMTVPSLSLRELIDAAVARGIPAVAPWRSLLDEIAVPEAARVIRESGLRVSSLCRGGMFTAATERERRSAMADTRLAVEQAATLGADCLVLVCGPVVGKDVAGSFSMVRDGIGAVLDDSRAAGVRLGIEPLHPMMAADRSVVTTAADAWDLKSELDPGHDVGIVIDAYHVWWDRTLPDAMSRIGDHVCGLHVSDWVTPLTGCVTTGRGMMGDGSIDLPALVRSVPWNGDIEVEVLSDYWWGIPPARTLDIAVERFQSHV